MRFLLLISILILLASTQVGSAVEQKKIIKQELIESEYGVLGDFFGVGDRLYQVTYQGGASEPVLRRTNSFLSKATIVSSPPEISVTEGQPVSINIVVQAPNLARFTGSIGFAEHKFKLFDDTAAQQILITEISDPNVPLNTTKTITFIISNFSTVGHRFYYLQEFVKDRTTGTWVSGSESASSEMRFEVIVNSTTLSSSQLSQQTIRVDTVPTGANVSYMDTVLGTTPTDIRLLAGESKILSISKEGYITTKKGISVGTTSPFVITLSSIEPVGATPTPTPTPTLPLESELEIQSSVSDSSGNSPRSSSPSTTTPTPTEEAGLDTTDKPELEKGNPLLYNIGVAGFILVSLIIIGYFGYTNLYVQKGTSERKRVRKLKKNKGGMWFD